MFCSLAMLKGNRLVTYGLDRYEKTDWCDSCGLKEYEGISQYMALVSSSFLLLLVRHLLLLAWHLFLVAWHLLLLVRSPQDPSPHSDVARRDSTARLHDDHACPRKRTLPRWPAGVFASEGLVPKGIVWRSNSLSCWVRKRTNMQLEHTSSTIGSRQINQSRGIVGTLEFEADHHPDRGKHWSKEISACRIPRLNIPHDQVGGFKCSTAMSYQYQL